MQRLNEERLSERVRNRQVWKNVKVKTQAEIELHERRHWEDGCEQTKVDDHCGRQKEILPRKE